eukprot:151728_1
MKSMHTELFIKNDYTIPFRILIDHDRYIRYIQHRRYEMVFCFLINGFLRSTSNQNNIEIVPLDLQSVIAMYNDNKNIEAFITYGKELKARMNATKDAFSDTWRSYLDSFRSYWRCVSICFVIPSVVALIGVLADDFKHCEPDYHYFIDPLLFLIIGAGIPTIWVIALLIDAWFVSRATKQIEQHHDQCTQTATAQDMEQFIADTEYKNRCLRLSHAKHTHRSELIIFLFVFIWCLCGVNFIVLENANEGQMSIKTKVKCWKNESISGIAFISWCYIILIESSIAGIYWFCLLAGCFIDVVIRIDNIFSSS